MSDTEKKKMRVTIIVALIGLLGTVLAAVLPIIIEDLRNSPNEPTATTTQSIASETPAGSILTDTPAVTDGTQASIATPVTPSLSCLDRWQAFSSSTKLPAVPTGSGDCTFSTDANLGIGAGRNGLVFAVSYLKEKGIYGISTPMPRNATIRVTVEVAQIDNGEFWVAFGRGIDPRQDSLVFAIQPDTGDIHTYIGRTTSASAYYLWSIMQAGQPSVKAGVRTYTFELHFDGSRVELLVNGIPFDTLASPSWEYLFLGYNADAQGLGTSLSVEVTDLTVEGQE